MATKLDKKEYPKGLGPDDFKCHGPVATEDTKFEGCMLADMGCFQQEEKGVSKDGSARKVDSNKFYHAAVVSDPDGDWYLYVEFGRVGNNPTFQFTQCSSKDEAMAAFVKQCKSKNTSRGVWDKVGGIDMFVPKKDSKGKLKDLYAVRPLVSRDTGLPDARNLSADDGSTQSSASSNGSKKKTKAKSKNRCDIETSKLMRDLLGGTIQHARTTLQGGTVPSQKALDQGRDLLQAALKRVGKVGGDVDNQVNDQELKQITYALYGLIPKIKPLNAHESSWILSANNINEWELEIDAFESALKTGDFTIEDDGNDPMAGMPLDMKHISKTSEIGKYLYAWWKEATKNRYGGRGSLTVHHLWEVLRHGDDKTFTKSQDQIKSEMKKLSDGDRPLHQDKKRPDLTPAQRRKYWETNTAALFHGTRSVNVAGILRENFRFPQELVNVATNGAAFGQGIYFADDWQKSSQYCSASGSMYAGDGGISGRHSFMMLCDVCLGMPDIAGTGGGRSMTASKGTHHVFGKGGMSGGYLANNEFIIYKKGRHMIKYLAEVSWR